MSQSLLVLALGLSPLGPWSPSGRSEDLEGAVERIVSAALDAGIRGLTLAVALGDDVVLERGWGDVEPGRAAEGDSLVPVGALGESFLAGLVLQLVEADELALDARLVALVPELAPEDDQAAGGPSDLERVTLLELLRHTSGLPSYEDWLTARGADRTDAIDPDALLAWLAVQPLEFEPGTCARYSDTNHWLLGRIVESETGTGVPHLLSSRVFRPAGMDDTSYEAELRALYEVAYDVHEFAGTEIVHAGLPRPFAADSLSSTAGDVLRWMRALVGRELLGEQGFRALTTLPELEHGSTSGRACGLDVTRLEGEPCFSAGGGCGGYRAHVAYYPGLDLTISVLAAGDEAPVRTLERSVARAAFGMAEPGVHDLPLTYEDALRYQGEYMVGCNLYRVAFDDGDLTLSTPTGRVLALAYQGRHDFLARDDATTSLRFFVEEGRAHSFVLVENGAESFGRRMG